MYSRKSFKSFIFIFVDPFPIYESEFVTILEIYFVVINQRCNFLIFKDFPKSERCKIRKEVARIG